MGGSGCGGGGEGGEIGGAEGEGGEIGGAEGEGEIEGIESLSFFGGSTVVGKEGSTPVIG